MVDANVKIRGGDGNATQIQSRDIDAAAPADTNVLAWSASDSEWEPTAAGAGGSGDVVGPGSSVDDRIATFDSTTGKLIQDGGKTIAEAEAAAVAAVPASGWTPGVNQVVLTTSGDNVGIGVAPTEKLQVDGVVALKSQGSAPSATADYAKLYAKDTDYSGATYKLVLHLDRNFDDSSASNHLVFPSGGVVLSTLTKKWGTGSVLFDGVDDYLKLDHSDDFDFGSGDFTVHFWYYPVTQGGNRYLMVLNHTDASTTYGQVTIDQSNTGSGVKLEAGSQDGSFTWTGFSAELALNTWHHIAYVRNGTDTTLYANGVPGTSAAVSGALTNDENISYIGKRPNDASPMHVNSYFDEIVIVKGTALWTADFSGALPTGPTASDSAVLWAQDEQGNDTRISPHNAQNEWEYYSRNSKTGRVVRINMEKSIRVLEELSGEKLIETE